VLVAGCRSAGVGAASLGRMRPLWNVHPRPTCGTVVAERGGWGCAVLLLQPLRAAGAAGGVPPPLQLRMCAGACQCCSPGPAAAAHDHRGPLMYHQVPEASHGGCD
jgi:hypothetical protein